LLLHIQQLRRAYLSGRSGLLDADRGFIGKRVVGQAVLGCAGETVLFKRRPADVAEVWRIVKFSAARVTLEKVGPRGETDRRRGMVYVVPHKLTPAGREP
jgi:hypothetical protein